MKSVLIHADAKAGWAEAADYYEACAPGLARAFVAQVSEALDRISRTPRVFPAYMSTRARKCLVARFPYVAFFVEFENVIWVAAVAHAKRQPGYWSERLSDSP
jgi:plasmid stabilization system protein ParE